MDEDDITELEKKVIQAIESPFAGEVLFTDDELQQLAVLCVPYFSYHRGLLYQEAANVFALFVNLTKKNVKVYDDEDYWLDPMLHSFSELASTDDEYCFGITANDFYKMMDKKVYPVLQEKGVVILQGGGRRFQATLSCHALAPTESVYALFDLCWKIVGYMARHNIPDVDALDSYLAGLLRSQYNYEIEDQSLAITHFREPYDFRVGLDHLLRFSPKEYCDLAKRIINRLNDRVDGNLNINNPPQNYLFDVLIPNWWNRQDSNDIKAVRRSKQNLEESKENFKSKPTVSYRLIKSDLYLHISSFYLSDFPNNYIDHVECLIKVSDTVIKKTPLNVYHKEPFNMVDEIDISLESSIVEHTEDYDNLLNELSIVLIQNGENILFDSESSLKREFILFSSSGDRFLKESTEYAPGDYLLYCYNLAECLVDYNVTLSPSDNLSIYYLSAADGQILKTNNNFLLFTNITSFYDPQFIGFYSRAYYQNEAGQQYGIITGDYIYIRISSYDNPANYLLTIHSLGQENEVLREILSAYPSVEYGDTKIITVGFKPKSKCVYSLMLTKWANNHRVDACVGIHNLTVDWNTNLSFKSELDDDIEISFFDKEVIKLKYDEGHNFVSIPGDKGKLFIAEPPIFQCRIDGGKWMTYHELQKNYMYQDFSRSFTIEFKPSYYNFQLIIGGETLVDNKLFGKKIYEKANSGVERCSVKISYLQNGVTKQSHLMYVYFKIGFINNPFKKQDLPSGTRQYIWSPSPDDFIGPTAIENKFSFTVDALASNYKTYHLNSGEKFNLSEEIVLKDLVNLPAGICYLRAYLKDETNHFFNDKSLVYEYPINLRHRDVLTIGDCLTFSTCCPYEESISNSEGYNIQLCRRYQIRHSKEVRKVNGKSEYEGDLYYGKLSDKDPDTPEYYSSKFTLVKGIYRKRIGKIVWKFYVDSHGNEDRGRIVIRYNWVENRHDDFDKSNKFLVENLGYLAYGMRVVSEGEYSQDEVLYVTLDD